MASWMEQYSAALDLRDAREKAHKSFVDAYTKLADQTATERNRGITAAANREISDTPQVNTPTTGGVSTQVRSTRPATKGAEDQAPSSTTVNALRTDLSATQKARAALQIEVASLTASLSTLQTTVDRSSSQIALLNRHKADAERKLRDRDEELRGKARLVEQAQDEMVSLSLQVNMAEQRSERLEKENKELVDRWMKRMGEEAERLNEGSGWR